MAPAVTATSFAQHVGGTAGEGSPHCGFTETAPGFHWMQMRVLRSRHPRGVIGVRTDGKLSADMLWSGTFSENEPLAPADATRSARAEVGGNCTLLLVRQRSAQMESCLAVSGLFT